MRIVLSNGHTRLDNVEILSRLLFEKCPDMSINTYDKYTIIPFIPFDDVAVAFDGVIAGQIQICFVDEMACSCVQKTQSFLSTLSTDSCSDYEYETANEKRYLDDCIDIHCDAGAMGFTCHFQNDIAILTFRNPNHYRNLPLHSILLYALLATQPEIKIYAGDLILPITFTINDVFIDVQNADCFTLPKYLSAMAQLQTAKRLDKYSFN